MAVFKAQAIARNLKQNLELAGLTVTQFSDASGFPTLKIGSDMYAKVMMFGNFGRVDSLGLAQQAYSPHMIKIATENVDAETASTAPLANPVSMSVYYTAIAAIACVGVNMEIWAKEAIGSSETDFDTITGLAKVCDIRVDAINPVLSSQ
jgi:hypothetical protein